MAEYRVTLVLITNRVERRWRFEGDPPELGETITVHPTVSDPGPKPDRTRARLLHVDDDSKTITAAELSD